MRSASTRCDDAGFPRRVKVNAREKVRSTMPFWEEFHAHSTSWNESMKCLHDPTQTVGAALSLCVYLQQSLCHCTDFFLFLLVLSHLDGSALRLISKFGKDCLKNIHNVFTHYEKKLPKASHLFLNIINPQTWLLFICHQPCMITVFYIAVRELWPSLWKMILIQPQHVWPV